MKICVGLGLSPQVRPLKRALIVGTAMSPNVLFMDLLRERRLCSLLLREAKPGVSKPGCFPLFSGKVQIVSRILSGLFLVGALKRPRKRKGTNRENPRTIPEQIGKIPEKSGKSQKGQKGTKKEGQVQIGKPPV